VLHSCISFGELQTTVPQVVEFVIKPAFDGIVLSNYCLPHGSEVGYIDFGNDIAGRRLRLPRMNCLGAGRADHDASEQDAVEVELVRFVRFIWHPRLVGNPVDFPSLAAVIGE
jgi:hypothetical protein